MDNNNKDHLSPAVLVTVEINLHVEHQEETEVVEKELIYSLETLELHGMNVML